VTAALEGRRSEARVSDDAGNTLHKAGGQLIVDAFQAAQRSGRSDWARMTLAVLKNRILDASGRGFDQESWGAATFRDFVEQFSDIVRIDFGTKPLTVELLPGAVDGGQAVERLRIPPRPDQGQRWLIRPDLWNATLDYSSGAVYLWEGGTVVRVPKAGLEPAEPRLRLPTVSTDEMRGWRSAFAERSTTGVDNPGLVAAVTRWRDESLTGKALPGSLHWRWVEALKSHVRDHLETWFQANGLTVPTDLIVSASVERPTDDSEQLRSLVIRCVQMMTRAELEDLRLPASVVLRTRT
jgi:hypothetical protein